MQNPPDKISGHGETVYAARFCEQHLNRHLAWGGDPKRFSLMHGPIARLQSAGCDVADCGGMPMYRESISRDVRELATELEG